MDLKKLPQPRSSTAEPSGIFANLDQAQIDKLLGSLVQLEVASGSKVCIFGAKSRELYLIISGVVEVSRTERLGRKIILGYRGPGEFVGEIAAISGLKRTADVIAVGPCKIAEIKSEQIEDLLRDIPKLGTYLIRLLANRLAETTSQAIDLATNDVPTRVLKALRSQAQSATGAVQGGLVVDPRPTQEQLAAMVGTSREVVSRAMKLLANSGEILLDGPRIFVRRQE